jgi:hypothetical protein
MKMLGVVRLIESASVGDNMSELLSFPAGDVKDAGG